MKIETELRDDHQMKLVAELEKDTLERYLRRAARKISQETKIPGFRPGKAPYDVVRRVIGEELIEKQAIELMVDDFYPQALDEAKLKPSGPGLLEEVLSVDPPKFAFLVPLQPEVQLGDYRAIRKEYSLEEVSEKEVESVLRNLRSGYATAEPAQRPAQEGDLVYIKLSAHLIEPSENENATLLEDSPYQIIIGEDHEEDEEWPFKGFSKELIGLAENEEKTLSYTYPEDSNYEKLRGRQVEYHVTVQSVKSITLPELNDEFARTLGDYENLEELRKGIREQLEAEKQREYDQEYVSKVIDQIVEDSTIKYPPQVLEDEIEHVLRLIEQDLSEQKMDLETYLKLRGIERETFIENEIKPTAIKRLRRSLVVEEIARQEKIDLDRDELTSAVSQTMNQLQQQPGFDNKVRTGRDFRNLANYLTLTTASRLLDQHVMARLKAIASGQLDQGGQETALESSATESPEPVPQAKAEAESEQGQVDSDA